MDHSTVIIVVTATVAGFGLHKLGQIALMWNEFGFAKQHADIDRKGLEEWVTGFGKKMALVNLAAFLSLGLGIAGFVFGRIVVSEPYAPLLFVVSGTAFASACKIVYEGFYDEYARVVGIPAPLAFEQVSEGW